MKKFNMDEVITLICEVVTLMEQKADLSDRESDKLWDELVPVFEKFFGYPDYSNYN
jgi:hypothetical protein